MSDKLFVAYFILAMSAGVSWLVFCTWFCVWRLKHKHPFSALATFFSPVILWALYTVATA